MKNSVQLPVKNELLNWCIVDHCIYVRKENLTFSEFPHHITKDRSQHHKNTPSFSEHLVNFLIHQEQTIIV